MQFKYVDEIQSGGGGCFGFWWWWCGGGGGGGDREDCDVETVVGDEALAELEDWGEVADSGTGEECDVRL